MAKKKAAPASASTTKLFYGVLAVIAVVGIGSIVYASTRSAGMATEPLDMSQVTDAESLLQRAQPVHLGDENAPIQMFVFSDFMCPACGVWSSRVEPHVKREFVETGKVRLTYYDFPLGGAHKYSFAAARAARCASDQGKFWDYHDRLFGSQQQWSYSAGMPTDFFLQYATELGLDMDAFESCLRSDQHAEVVTANKVLGETLGVGGTPTIFVNGRQMTADWRDYGEVKAFLDGLVSPSAPAADAAAPDSAAQQ